MSIKQQIQDSINAFAVELEALVREAAIDAITNSLGSGPSAPRARTRISAGTPIGANTAVSFKRKKGEKRTPEQLAHIDAAIVAFVKANSGKGVEHMAKALGVPSKDLKLRVPLLLSSRKLKKTGVKRATKYFAT
jgi:hypothetical protein